MGSVDERSGEGDALLLAAGHLPRLAGLEPRHLDQAQGVVHAGRHLGLGHLLPPQPERYVLEHVQMREQRVGLEHGVDVAFVGWLVRDVSAAEEHRPSRRLLEPADHPERRRLPAPGGTEHAEELSFGDVQREIVDGQCLTEGLRHPFEANVDIRQAASRSTEEYESMLLICLRSRDYASPGPSGPSGRAGDVRPCHASPTSPGCPTGPASTPNATARRRHRPARARSRPGPGRRRARGRPMPPDADAFPRGGRRGSPTD